MSMTQISNAKMILKIFTLQPPPPPPGRPAHSDTNSASPGSILAMKQLRAMTTSQTRTHNDTHTRTHTRAHTHVHTHTHTHTHKHTHTHTRKLHAPTRSQAHAVSCIQVITASCVLNIWN